MAWAMSRAPVGMHGLGDVARTGGNVGGRYQFVLKIVQRLRPGAAQVGLEMPIRAQRQPKQRDGRHRIERQRVLNQAFDRRKTQVTGGKHQPVDTMPSFKVSTPLRTCCCSTPRATPTNWAARHTLT